jgi:PAS domain S-box-containing protein
MIVKTVMIKNPDTLYATNTLQEAAEHLAQGREDYALVVDSQGRLMGRFTSIHLINAVKNGRAFDTALEGIIDRNVEYIHENDKAVAAFDKKNEIIPVVDCDNKLVGIVTKAELLKQYYKRLEYTTNSLNAMLESTNNAIIAVDVNSNITVFNNAAENILGIRAQDALGKNVANLLPNSNLPKIVQEGTSEIAKTMLFNNKTLVTNRTPIIQNGKIAGAVSVFQDITDYRNILQELDVERNNTEVLKTILEIAYDGIVVVDRDAKITMMSKAYANFLGVNEEEVIGKDVTDVIENTRMHIIVKTGQPEIAYLQKIKDNYMVATRIPIIKNGVVVGAVGKVLFRNLKDLNFLYNKISKMEKELEHYRGELKQLNKATYSFESITGESRKIKEAKSLAQKAASTDSNVLLLGESGTGKELFAHAIHSSSKRVYGPFVKVNCAAIPSDLLESELFGYEGGAFTGAKKEGKSGKFEIADGGTIFLDEIGDMPLHMQAKLLRVLQEREVEKIGASKPKSVDVRVIAATNRSLDDMVKQGSFRADLFYRLNVVTISIPPLKERDEDIALLSNYLLGKICKRLGKYVKGISEDAMEYLRGYEWVGNVRELENVIERAVNIVDNEGLIRPQHLPNGITGQFFGKEVRSLEDILQDAERKAILDSILVSRGNRSKAARLLNISRSSLYEKMSKYGINEE